MGKSMVRVSTINGNIKIGDYITTSTIPGVAQKATENGYVIGVAQQNYNNKDPNKIVTIYVTLHLNFGLISMGLRENLLVAFRQGMRAPFSSPLNTLRYLISAVTALLSFAAGFWFFGKVSSRGVEAIGRNPLARRFILLSVLFNVGITVSVMLLGVALAYIILVI
jgi:F0F1-type ATP synthase membrane subunit c/vacuolar-type H+-ATPase subunit K